MTSFKVVFEAFLAKLDEYDLFMDSIPESELIEELRLLLNRAIFDFRISRVDLSLSDSLTFANDLTNDEVQILANFMWLAWIRRQLTSMDNIRQQYGDKDFALSSQANHLHKLQSLQAAAYLSCQNDLDEYDRFGHGMTHHNRYGKRL